jgi:hypothetical protein
MVLLIENATLKPMGQAGFFAERVLHFVFNSST